MPSYYEQPSPFPLKGGCSCGHIRYTVTEAPILVHCCHCTACQRETGSAFAINALVESSLITLDPSCSPTIPGGPGSEPKPVSSILPMGKAPLNAASKSATEEDDPFMTSPVPLSAADSPTPVLFPFPTESGFPQSIARCPRCSTALWSHYHAGFGPHVAFIRVGTLDNAWKVQPDAHIYTRSKVDFVTIADGKPQFDEFYPNMNAVMRPEGLERYARISPKAIESAKAASARIRSSNS